ncbi:citrate lyase beta subunit [Leucobacter exalbidus]|uniref:Citrate lyase beta subunit n=1 Tax=Leucobacter exalbidus TaxID=662960 RepID=A0A940T1X8_9MICO|nr:CoA ester lyase [Leucobacter exalbidus]MBP1327300.1 citrate lyase beta subunit [Leucobacter exalbidus]
MLQSSISYLFVPASRPERFAKALAAGAGQVIIDLEDAVAVEDKDTSLAHLIEALNDGLDTPVHVRINAADSPWFNRDIAALAALTAQGSAGLSGVIIPKAEDAAVLAEVRTALGGDIELIALVESALGVSRARELAQSPELSRFAVGAVDLSFDLDVEISSSTIDYAYAALVVESRLAGLPAPIASPPLSLHDTEGNEIDARRLRGMGLTAQLCIHPAQLAPIHAGFLPTAEQFAWARNVLAAEGGASQVGGQMVDKPVQDRARRILSHE